MPLQVTTQCTNGQLHLKKAGRERSEGEICDSIELLWWCCAERSAFNARPTSDPYARFSLTHFRKSATWIAKIILVSISSTMKLHIYLSVLLVHLTQVSGFQARNPSTGVKEFQRLFLSASSDDYDESLMTTTSASRRGFLASTASMGLGLLAMPRLTLADEASKSKVLVLGGTGLVGSRVVKTLQDAGVSVVATSRDGRDGTVALDFTKDTGDDLKKKVSELAADCTAVISCVGAIGTADDKLVNSGTGIAAIAAKGAGVQQFVYITVAPEVKTFAKDLEFLKNYMDGKTFSRDTVLATFPSGATLIEPTFIYGGDEFAINPPRVAGFYGSFIEGLLGSGPIRSVEGILPEGIVKIALKPPVAADDVAKAAVAGGLGKATAILDTHDKITSASSLV